jgi:hypothetical protein
MSSQARDPSERIAAALEAIAHSLAVGVELQRDKRRKAGAPRAKRQHRPPPGPPPDELAVQLAKQALRRIGR